jgi:hypothetical protein
VKYNDEAIEKLIMCLASPDCGCCPSELGFEDLPNKECDMIKHSKCVNCWKQSLAGEQN